MVAHELFGITGHVREVCDRLAQHGYAAVAPDFFQVGGPATELTEDADGRKRGFELLGALTRDQALDRAGQAIEYADSLTPGPVGLLGLSVGGHIAYLAAGEYEVAATAVAYAGWLAGTDIPLSQPEPTITRTERIAAPILVLVGEDDQLVGPSDRDAIATAFDAYPVDGRLVTYPGVGHGFLCATRASYNQAASQSAWDEIDGLFAANLGS